MTVPSNIIFPLRADFNQIEDIERYLRDLTFELQRMYENLAQGVNGDIRASAFTQRDQWTPILDGTTATGTFTYVHQIGWVLKRGLWIQIWFDVQWSAVGTATGNLFLTLPYLVANSAQIPFSNTIQPSNISYGSGQTALHINAITNTYRGEIWSSGSGNATANLTVPASGRLIGSLTYLGVQDET